MRLRDAFSETLLFASPALLDALSVVCEIAPREVSKTTLPMLFGLLPDRAPTREADAERQKYQRVLKVLKRLCINAELFEVLVIRLTTKLDLICVDRVTTSSPGSTTSDRDALECSAAYAHSVLSTLEDVLKTKVEALHPDVHKYIDRLVPRLFNLFFHAAAVEGRKAVAVNPRLVVAGARIIALIARSLPVGCVFRSISVLSWWS